MNSRKPARRKQRETRKKQNNNNRNRTRKNPMLTETFTAETHRPNHTNQEENETFLPFNIPSIPNQSHPTDDKNQNGDEKT